MAGARPLQEPKACLRAHDMPIRLQRSTSSSLCQTCASRSQTKVRAHDGAQAGDRPRSVPVLSPPSLVSMSAPRSSVDLTRRMMCSAKFICPRLGQEWHHREPTETTQDDHARSTDPPDFGDEPPCEQARVSRRLRPVLGGQPRPESARSSADVHGAGGRPLPGSRTGRGVRGCRRGEIPTLRFGRRLVVPVRCSYEMLGHTARVGSRQRARPEHRWDAFGDPNKQSDSRPHGCSANGPASEGGIGSPPRSRPSCEATSGRGGSRSEP